jgi:hypothetical protein
METGYRVLAAAVGWFVIGLQYYLTVGKADGDFVLAATRLLSFFTILTKILVALAMTLPWLAPESRFSAFFSRPSVRTAIACYIIVDPLGYAAFSLIHGAVTGFYPYPLLSVMQLGYARVLLNMSVLTAAFAVLGLILVGIDRLLGALGDAQRELTRVNSLGICWPQDRPRRFGDELLRARGTARKGLESMHHPDHRGQKAVPLLVASEAAAFQSRTGGGRSRVRGRRWLS